MALREAQVGGGAEPFEVFSESSTHFELLHKLFMLSDFQSMRPMARSSLKSVMSLSHVLTRRSASDPAWIYSSVDCQMLLDDYDSGSQLARGARSVKAHESLRKEINLAISQLARQERWLEALRPGRLEALKRFYMIL